jgi:hypothetical protein
MEAVPEQEQTDRAIALALTGRRNTEELWDEKLASILQQDEMQTGRL